MLSWLTDSTNIALIRGKPPFKMNTETNFSSKVNTNGSEEENDKENLLFKGLLYHVMTEPDYLRDSTIFLDIVRSNTSLDEIAKAHNFELVIQNIERMKYRDSAFEAFLEKSRYSLVFLDHDLCHIFHNEKSKNVIDQLLDNSKPRKLKNEIIDAVHIEEQTQTNKKDKIIFISGFNDNNTTFYLLKKGDFNKDQEINILLIPDNESKEFKLPDTLSQKYNLTKKEILVLTYLVSGSDIQQISKQIFISANTVRSHLKSIYRKTSTKSQPDLIRLILSHESRFLGSYFDSSDLIQTKNEKTDSKDKFVKLCNGNQICYQDYGSREGRPLIILHNILGSRFNIPHNYYEILNNTNRRVIIPEKPGFGKSDKVENYSINWNAMLVEIANKIGISKFDLLGNVTGSASAVSFALEYPDMLRSVTLSSPFFINDLKQIKLLGQFGKNSAQALAISPTIAKYTYRLWIKSIKGNPEKFIRKMIQRYAGSKEIESGILEDQNYIDRLVLNFVESQRNNSDGSAQDSEFCCSPLNLDLGKIAAPFHIWIGDEDSLISLESAKEICEPIPNKTFHIREGYGEDIFYHFFEEMIR